MLVSRKRTHSFVHFFAFTRSVYKYSTGTILMLFHALVAYDVLKFLYMYLTNIVVFINFM